MRLRSQPLVFTHPVDSHHREANPTMADDSVIREMIQIDLRHRPQPGPQLGSVLKLPVSQRQSRLNPWIYPRCRSEAGNSVVAPAGDGCYRSDTQLELP